MRPAGAGEESPAFLFLLRLRLMDCRSLRPKPREFPIGDGMAPMGRGVATALPAPCRLPVSEEDMPESITHDVLILGAGLAGLRAAVEISRRAEGKDDIGGVSKGQLMRAHSVCAEGGPAAWMRP